MRLVLKVGIEPTRYCYHRILSPARLPIPPLKHFNNGVSETIRTSDPLIKSQLLYLLSYGDKDGADYRNRTHNLLITSQLLYLLS